MLQMSLLLSANNLASFKRLNNEKQFIKIKVYTGITLLKTLLKCKKHPDRVSMHPHIEASSRLGDALTRWKLPPLTWPSVVSEATASALLYLRLQREIALTA
jgi:hypothetical protein